MLEGKKTNIRVGGDFEALPVDKYTAQISDVNLVTQFNKFKGVEEEMLNFQFTILDDKETESGESTRGRLVWQRVSQTLGGRSKLGKLAIAVTGRELTKDEMETFDPESLVGKQVDIMVVQNPSADGTTIYNNIISVSKALKQLEALDTVTKPTTVTKQTVGVAAVAPDAGEDAQTFIDKTEKDSVEKDAVDEELVAAERAAEEARARVAAAKKKVATQ